MAQRKKRTQKSFTKDGGGDSLMLFSRYLVKNFLKVFLLMQFSWVFVFVIIDFVGQIRMWMTYEVKDVLEYYLNYLPHIVYLIMPVAIILSVVGVVGRMSMHLELVAMLSAGRSMNSILVPLLGIGIFLSGLSFTLSEYILPDANHRRLELAQPKVKGKAKDKRITSKRNYVYIGKQRESLYLGRYSAKTRSAKDVVILLFKNGRLWDRMDAREMRWHKATKKNEGYWQLRQGFRRRFHKGNVTTTRFRQLRLNENQLEVHPEDLINSRHSPDEMDTDMILQRIDVLRRIGEDTRPMETQYHFKFSGPFINFIILIIGAALAHRYSRSGGISFQFAIGLLVIFIYYIVVRVGIQLGESGVLEPWLGAWLGNMIFALVALVIYIRSLRL
jgi:lipopolysaccharide export system permease protein